jgi:hypothetical protein
MIPLVGMLASAGMDLISKFIDTGKDKAVEVIKDKTGIDLSTKKELNPDDIKKLKEFQENNRDFLLKQIELANEDRADARAMQKVALNQGSWFAKNFIYLFAIVWSVFAMLYISFITFYTIPQASQRFADTILGFLLGTIVSAIIQFFYGSSMGSKNKDEILSKASK